MFSLFFYRFFFFSPIQLCFYLRLFFIRSLPISSSLFFALLSLCSCSLWMSRVFCLPFTRMLPARFWCCRCCYYSRLQLVSALEKLAQLQGQQYGEVSLEAGNILRLARAAPFEGRLSALRAVSVCCHVPSHLSTSRQVRYISSCYPVILQISCTREHRALFLNLESMWVRRGSCGICPPSELNRTSILDYSSQIVDMGVMRVHVYIK